MGFQELISLIQNGEAVNAGVTNRPLDQLNENIRYLRDLISMLNAGSAIFARDATVETDALVGMPVYYNGSNQRFERALAAAYTDTETGLLMTAVSSQVWGVVAAKTNATKADILLHGLSDIDLTQSAGGNAAGRYYLSGTTPGGLSQQQPPVTVPVLLADGQGQVLVTPQTTDFLQDHKHHRFTLVCEPAGTHSPPLPGERHEITNADPDVEGWLPADHSSFAGKAPAGALFGYNLAASPLGQIWPPTPLQSAYLEWNTGRDAEIGGTGVPLGLQGLAIIDANGIWWMSDCYGDVPWPLYLDTESQDSADSAVSEECPRLLEMSLTLWFTRMVFLTSGTVVTSLRAAAGSRLSLTCIQTGEAAVSGDLEIDLDLEFVQGADDTAGHLVFKSLDGNNFLRGPVVEALQAGTSNVTLVSSAQDGSNHQGTVQLFVDTDAAGKELPVQQVRLDGVTEEYYQSVVALGFAAGRTSNFRGVIRVPSQLGTNMNLQLRLRLMGRAAGTLPAMSLTYRRLSRPSAVLSAAVALPLADSTLAISTNGVLASANQYVEALSSAFTVSPGDVVFFTLGRSDGDAYSGEVHVLDQVGVLSALP